MRAANLSIQFPRLKTACARALALIALAQPALVCAQAEVAAGAARVEPMSAEYIVKTVIGMIIVIGLIVGLAWLMRRMGHMHGMLSGHIKVVSSLAIGGREKLLLVQVGDEQFLLGATPTQINSLARLASPVAVDAAPGGGDKPSFQALLSKLKHGPKS